MLIAITGGSGFIGRALVKAHIRNGDSVRILSRQPRIHPALDGAILYRGDLTSSAELLVPFVEGADVLYHCAGEIHDPQRMHAVHVQGTGNLCSASRGRIGHWVQLSSVGSYGYHAGGRITEDTPPNPVGPYETTKTISDRCVIEASEGGAFSCSVLRPSNVYGPEMSNRHLFRLMEMIERGLFFFIGRPGASANYIHVANVVDALMLCGRVPASRGKTFNLSDHCTFEAFVSAMAEELGRPSPSLRLPEPPVRWLSNAFGSLPGFPLTATRINAMTTRCIYPIDRIQNELGYAHEVTMDEGIRQLVRTWKGSG